MCSRITGKIRYDTCMHKNIRKLYFLNLLCGIVLWYPIEKLFLQELGAGPLGISINAIVFLVTLIIFDVPSGVLADRWKRTYVLLLALACLIASCLVGGFAQTWVQYLPMNVLLGGFMVLVTGTFQAMMYDSLRDSGHEKEYDKHQGRAFGLHMASLGVSALMGGYVADWVGMPGTYFITAGVMAAAVFVCLGLTEPKSHKPVADRKLRRHISHSVKQILASRLLLQLALLLTAMGVLRGTHNEYSGVLFIALGFGMIPLGYAAAGKWLVSALGQVVAPKIGRRALRLIPLFFLASLVFSLLHTPWTLFFFYAAGILYSIIANQAEAVVQENTPSDIRATTLSIFSFTGNVLLIPLGLLFGWVAERTNVFNAYLVIALIGLVYLADWLLRGRKTLRRVWATA